LRTFCRCLAPTFNNIALFRLPLATAVTLGATGPLFALPIKYYVDGEKSSGRAVLGAATAVAGVALLAFAPSAARVIS
jgi:drug/metabolite transporter (DMT)-like permease